MFHCDVYVLLSVDLLNLFRILPVSATVTAVTDIINSVMYDDDYRVLC